MYGQRWRSWRTEGEGWGCEKIERDEADCINQDGRRLKRREACLVLLGEEKSRCDAKQQGDWLCVLWERILCLNAESVYACVDECAHQYLMREGYRGSPKPKPVKFCHKLYLCLPVFMYVLWVCIRVFRDLKVTHECSPQSAGSWLSCLSSSRWSWVWAPRWPGRQTMQLRPRYLSGPLGIWRNLASLRKMERRGQSDTESDKKREGKKSW